MPRESQPNPDWQKPMNSIDAAIQFLKAEHKHAKETWTYEELLAFLLPRLQTIIDAGGSRREAEAVIPKLQYCLEIARPCSERDHSLVGVADNLQRLLSRVIVTKNLKSESVAEALEALAMEIEFCLSRDQ
jgi:hypothetical protein